MGSQDAFRQHDGRVLQLSHRRYGTVTCRDETLNDYRYEEFVMPEAINNKCHVGSVVDPDPYWE